MDSLGSFGRIVRKTAIAVAAVAMTVAAATPAHAGVWLQQYGKTGKCSEGWGVSWAEWAVPVTGGAVCTRELDDPSVPVAMAETPPPPPAPAWAWEYRHTFTLAPGAVTGGSLVGFCTNGSDPGNIRAVPNTDIATLYYAQLMEGYLENLSISTTRTFDLELYCYG
jgi:hypothetical protein